jgi:hypothetical protein
MKNPALVPTCRGHVAVSYVSETGARVDLGTTRKHGESISVPAHVALHLAITLGTDFVDVFEEIRALDVDALSVRHGAFEAKGLGAQLSRFSSLRELNYEMAGWLRDDDVAALSAMKRLEILRMPEAWALTDEIWKHLALVPHLSVVDVYGCGRLKGDGIAALNEAGTLAELNLSMTGVTAENLERLYPAQLRILAIRNLRVRPATFQRLSTWPALRNVDARFCAPHGAEWLPGGSLTSDARLRLDRIYGYAPVQADGVIDDEPFYFRARHNEWSFEVGDENALTFEHHEVWGRGSDASWMPHPTAEELILRAAALFLAQRDSPQGSS